MSESADRTTTAPSVLAFPMHGMNKMLAEGFRTRDAHFIEWMAELTPGIGPVDVLSRPEPPLLGGRRNHSSFTARNIRDRRSTAWRAPHPLDRRRWWVDSARHYRAIAAPPTVPAVIWNPFVSLSSRRDEVFNGDRVTVADLLDDWTAHYAFESIRPQVKLAYQQLFDQVDFVFANAEGTAELAKSYGRSDVELVPNGVDPERFSQVSTAAGPLTVGYVGKIGKRVDLGLVVRAATALPDVRFVFAGPILDREYRQPLRQLANVSLLGDVHYSRVPSLLQSFDLGWVPHRVGEFEVGGDVIKSYEYRAAGLPVLTTPVVGAGARGLSSVYALPAQDHVEWIRSLTAQGPRIDRDLTPVPVVHTWKGKARRLLGVLGLSG